MSTTVLPSWIPQTVRRQPIKILLMPLEPCFSCLDSALRCVYRVCESDSTVGPVLMCELGETPLSSSRVTQRTDAQCDVCCVHCIYISILISNKYCMYVKCF